MTRGRIGHDSPPDVPRAGAGQRSTGSAWPSLAFFGALTVVGIAVANAGSGVAHPDTYRWWRSLDKPPYTPPDPVIPAVWSVMYTLAVVSASRVGRRAPDADRRRALVRWGVQLGLNGLWTRLFFGHRRPDLALADSAALFASIAAYARAADAVDRPAALLVLPYLGWVGFATVLNADLVRRNPPPDVAAQLG